MFFNKLSGSGLAGVKLFLSVRILMGKTLAVLGTNYFQILLKHFCVCVHKNADTRNTPLIVNLELKNVSVLFKIYQAFWNKDHSSELTP